MRYSLLFPALTLGLMGFAPSAQAQGWDPVQKATGWSRVDRDSSCTFYDPASRSFQTWMKDGGIMGSLDISKAGLTPERWVLDSQGNAWIVSKTNLQQVEKTGKPGKKETLPAEVADLAWDAKGFVLSYRTREPYLEKREYKTGQVIWSYGNKPSKNEAPGRILHRISVSEDGNVMLVSGTTFAFQQIDGQKGKALGQVVFSFNNALAPELSAGDVDRPALAWWVGHTTGFMGVPGSQVPAAKIQGLVLARLDLSRSAVTFQPTGVTEDFVLVGVTDTEAILQAPTGGLTFIPLQ